MSNSPLVDYTKLSPHCHSPRKHKIDTVTIHCYVGQASVESMGEWFSNPDSKASCNYGIGVDGRIALIVDEGDRSWCSSSSSNDNRAITIECASDMKSPYAVNDKVYESLIKLLADICNRNDIKSLKWKGDKSLIGQVDKQNMTVHRWFKNKDCPGEYLYSRHGKIAEEVNAMLNRPTDADENKEYPKTPFTVNVLIDDLNYRALPSMNGAVQGQTGKGIFTIIEVSDGWGKLKSGNGWIWLGNPSYCAIGKAVDDDKKFKPYVVGITGCSKLNIRRGPGTNYGTNGVITTGAFTIIEEKPGKGSDKGWGKLKSGAGWISLDYTKKI